MVVSDRDFHHRPHLRPTLDGEHVATDYPRKHQGRLWRFDTAIEIVGMFAADSFIRVRGLAVGR
jgi:hypothetical protein